MNRDHSTDLEAAGFERRFILAGHPAYPDPLTIWPPTEEQAAKMHSEFVKPFDDYVAALGHVPFGVTRENFNPRVLITWVYTAEKAVFTP